MANSMTGFGLGEYRDENYLISVEIRAVNHKYLDINPRLPKKVSFLEDKLRNSIKERISRGRIEVFVKFEVLKSSGVELKYDDCLAKQYVEILNSIRDDFKIEKPIDVVDVASFSDVVTILEANEDEEELWNALNSALSIALEGLVEMRAIEGEKLKKDVLLRSNLLEKSVNKVEGYSEFVVQEQRDKLHSRIKDVLGDNEIDENRMAQEIAIYAEKCNITEEIVRFKSHIVQLRENIEASGSVGRKIDFLIQEMNREVNTMGSKTSKLEITNLVIDMKSELEKIREQIQNIE